MTVKKKNDARIDAAKPAAPIHAPVADSIFTSPPPKLCGRNGVISALAIMGIR